jgi:hypothetical protein
MNERCHKTLCNLLNHWQNCCILEDGVSTVFLSVAKPEFSSVY